MNDTFKYYLYDLGFLVKNMAIEAKADKDRFLKDDYRLGYLMALHDVVSLMKEQAIAFEIDEDLLSLKGINPDSDLL